MEIKVFNDSFIIEYEYELSGQKKVYKVRDREGKIKILKTFKFDDVGDSDRIVREAQILEEINSKYYPKIYSKDISLENKMLYILEEFIEGEKLSDLKNLYIGNEEKSVNLLKELIEGLKEIWNKDIVHRDLKPDNIIIRKDTGIPVILDLGIAKNLKLKKLTNAQRMPYSTGYVAPEQYKNEAGAISQRTDFFILGIVLYELYTGKHPFDLDNNVEIDKNIMNKQFKEIKGNSFLNSLFLKLLDKQPYRRFRNYNMITEFLEKRGE